MEGIDKKNHDDILKEERKRGEYAIGEIFQSTYLLGNNDSELPRIKELLEEVKIAPDVETINRLIEEAGGIRSSKQRDNPFDVIVNKKTN